MGESRGYIVAAIVIGVLNILLTLPFVIAYFTVFDKVDPTLCSDVPYNFGKFAKWSYLACTIATGVVAIFQILCALVCGEEGGMISGICGNCIQALVATLAEAIWIYSIVALVFAKDVNGGECQDTSYVNLLWATVLYPAILTGLLCVCGCCACIVGGGVAIFGNRS